MKKPCYIVSFKTNGGKNLERSKNSNAEIKYKQV
jgi:hypothetical protein